MDPALKTLISITNRTIPTPPIPISAKIIYFTGFFSPFLLFVFTAAPFRDQNCDSTVWLLYKVEQ